MTRLSPNQIVAFNLWLARELNGWTQETAAERLEPFLGERWSRIVFSAAERSVTGKRIRQFSADDIFAFAATFRLPVSFFFMPPPNVDEVAARTARNSLSAEQMVALAESEPGERERRIAEIKQERFRELETMGVRFPATETKPGRGERSKDAGKAPRRR
jgi:hypothetical protein